MKVALQDNLSRLKLASLEVILLEKNILSLTAIIDHIQKENEQAILISFDFEKAFDMVDWRAVQGTLTYFNCGPVFKSMVSVIYQDSCTCVQNNGYFSDWFYVTWGLKQGDALSCYIFLVIIEILAIELRANPNIKAMNALKNNKWLGQYADDIWKVIKYDQKLLDEVLLTFKHFSNSTGLKINCFTR